MGDDLTKALDRLAELLTANNAAAAKRADGALSSLAEGVQKLGSHIGIIRGTPCSTVATVAPGHSSGGSGGQGCRGYGQTSWPQWTQHPAIILRVGLAVDDVETSPRVQS